MLPLANDRVLPLDILYTAALRAGDPFACYRANPYYRSNSVASCTEPSAGGLREAPYFIQRIAVMKHRLSGIFLSMLVCGACLALAACGGGASASADASSSDEIAESADTIASGSFTDKGGQETSGAYQIEDTGAGLRLVLSETFRTDWGPDLHVVLTPTGTAEADNDNVMVTGAHVVGELQSRSGAQTYTLEADLDISYFQSVIIHCIRFTHLYGAAPLALDEG